MELWESALHVAGALCVVILEKVRGFLFTRLAGRRNCFRSRASHCDLERSFFASVVECCFRCSVSLLRAEVNEDQLLNIFVRFLKIFLGRILKKEESVVKEL